MWHSHSYTNMCITNIQQAISFFFFLWTENSRILSDPIIRNFLWLIAEIATYLLSLLLTTSISYSNCLHTHTTVTNVQHTISSLSFFLFTNKNVYQYSKSLSPYETKYHETKFLNQRSFIKNSTDKTKNQHLLKIQNHLSINQYFSIIHILLLHITHFTNPLTQSHSSSPFTHSSSSTQSRLLHHLSICPWCDLPS